MVDGSTSRERFVVAAARLFASQGYRTTSVADIQVECGLTPGSGALYKHFASKRELLEAVIETHVTTMRDGRRWFADSLPEDPEAALRATAEAVVDGITRDRHAVRLMVRDLDTEPELRDRMWHEVRANVYVPFAAWLDDASRRGHLGIDDPTATAATLMAALTCAPLLDTLIGHTPGDVDTRRFIDAWTRVALATLRAPDERTDRT